MNDQKTAYLELCDNLQKHNYLYYVLDAPVIEDATYDHLLRQVKDYETTYPEWVHPESPTQTVGHPVYPGHFQIAQHGKPMLSLDNVFTHDEAIDWTCDTHTDSEDLHNDDYAEIVPEWKMDGLSLDLEYHYGILKIAITRGDGTQGEDVTPNALMIEGVPRKVETSEQVLYVRGEVLPRLVDYHAINHSLAESGKKTYANPRNYASGSLRLKDPKATKERKLCFVAHGPEKVEVDPDGDWYKDQAWLKANGFMTADTGKQFSHTRKGVTTSIPKVLDECLAERPHHPFEVDGIVLKVVKHRHRERLGYANRYPRWAKAYKFPASKGTTTLLSVDRQVGRTGKLTPMARLVPIFIHGTTISNVTIHNLKELENHQLFKGCDVVISRAGDVIPYLESRVTEYVDQEVYGEVDSCPCCGTGVVVIVGKPSKKNPEGSRTEYCPNQSCPGRLEAHAIYAADRGVLNIKGLGDENVVQLIHKGVIDPKRPLSLLKLTDESFRQIGLSDRMSEKLHIAVTIADANLDLTRAITALGISNVAESTAEDLARHFRNLEMLANATIDQLIAIEGIGETTAQCIFEFFDNDNALTFDQSVWKPYVYGRVLPAPTEVGTLFKPGTTMVVTGSNFGGKTRKEMEKYFKTNGAKVTSSVSGSTTTVYCGTKYTGHKLDKAKELGIPYVVYDESGVVDHFGTTIQLTFRG